MNSRARKVCRVAAGLSQAAVAAAAGVSQSHFSQIELGRITPDADLARKIAATLGVTVEELFGTDPKQEAPVLVGASA